MAPAAASRNVFRPGKPASAGPRRQRAGTCQTWHATADQAIIAGDERRPDAILAFPGAGLFQPHCVAGPVQAARTTGLFHALQDTFTERTCGPASCTLSTRLPSEVHRYDAENPRRVGRAGRGARRIM